MLTVATYNSIPLKESFCDALHHEMLWHLFSPLSANFPKFAWSEVSRNIMPASLSSFFAIWQFNGLLDCQYRHISTLVQKENMLLKRALPGWDVYRPLI